MMEVRVSGDTYPARRGLKRMGLTWRSSCLAWCGEREQLTAIPEGCTFDMATSERIGSLWTLAEKCKAEEVEAWIDATVAATAVFAIAYADPERDWLQAITDLDGYRRERLSEVCRGVDDFERRLELQDHALQEFYEEVDQVIERFESQFQEA